MKIAHIINPYISDDYNNKILDITLKSIINSIDCVKYNDLDVGVFYTCYEEDLPIMNKYKEFKQLTLLNRSVLDIKDFNIPRKLPLVFDILDKFKEIDADYYIYTNIDIHLTKDFYNKVYEYIISGFDGMTINRVTIFNDNLNDINIDDLYNMVDNGEFHPGLDCFVFKKETLEKIPRVDFCIGINYFDKYLYYSLHKYSQNSLHLLKSKLTFHIGDDRDWLNDKFQDYRDYNRSLYNKHGFFIDVRCAAGYDSDDEYLFFIKYDSSLSKGIDKEIIKYFKKNKIYQGNFLQIGYYDESRCNLLSQCGWNGYITVPYYNHYLKTLKEYSDKNKIRISNVDVSDKKIIEVGYSNDENNSPIVSIEDLFNEIGTKIDLIILNKDDNYNIIKNIPVDVFHKCHIFAIDFNDKDDFHKTKMFLGTYGYNNVKNVNNCTLFSKI